MSTFPRLARTTESTFTPGIVHLGPGNFFRAFTAIYTQEAMADTANNWGIIAVSLKSPTARDQLKAQGCVYTSIALSAQHQTAEIIESVIDILVAPEDPEAVLAAMSNPDVRIISLTITEKGYCHDSSSGNLNLQHPDIKHDLGGGKPRSAIGFIVEALAQRRANEAAPFTVLSCDNLPDNGELSKRLVLQFAQQRDPALAAWIKSKATFPSTMVDRIAPATTEADIRQLAEQTGYTDLACVTHETYREWVIEDNFCAGRPAWNSDGVLFVDSVAAHEMKKLRCLNGTHSTLAYLGYLAGYETIAETVADPVFAQLCLKLWAEEILPTVPQPDGVDLQQYCNSLLERYQNPAIRHRTWQIAMDGSQKLPQRLLGTLSDNLANDRPIEGVVLAVAAWMRYTSGLDENKNAIDVKDPMADQLKVISAASATTREIINGYLSIDEVFSGVPQENDLLKNSLVTAYDSLLNNGARVSVKNYVS